MLRVFSSPFQRKSINSFLEIISNAIIIIIKDKNETHAGKKSKEISQARLGKF